jgi:hypothetical protein
VTPTEIFVAALRAVKARHGEKLFPAQTVEKFAWERWEKAVSRVGDKANLHPDEFAKEGQEWCECTLLEEVLAFSKARKLPKIRQIASPKPKRRYRKIQVPRIKRTYR